ncbi:MAG TPA: hypothetical protein VEQ58_14480, partial [Polyangiaceae bacterium]|nr:hypothetical protein [Polyangiaceae bacterium]
MTDPSLTASGEPHGRMMRDLMALSVLPTVWQRSEPLEVAQSLAMVLERTLGLALVGVIFEQPADGAVRHVVRGAGRLLPASEAEAVVRALQSTLGLAERGPEVITDPFGTAALRLVCQPVAWQAGR